ncbi:thioredoxin family protein [candidate division KSB1 bacterium]|nr:MAG: thioredoxin family protein [candidate division KSB1 bacterium]
MKNTAWKLISVASAVALIIAILVIPIEQVLAAPLAVGSSLISFSLKNVDGNTVSAADFADKAALVVVFSCNHCPYAVAYQDRLIALQKEYGARGVQFVLINPNDPKKQPQDSFENMQKRAKEKSYPFPYLFDETQQIAKAYGAARTPEVYLFGSDRKLVYQGRIDDNTEDKQVKTRDLKNALDLLLADTPDKISPRTTKAFGCTIKWKN